MADSLWAMSHPRNQAYQDALQRGAMDKDAHAPTWPSAYGDTMRGFDRALQGEYNRARFSGWGGPIPTPVLERDDEAVRELSNDEIRMHSAGQLQNLKELLAWREQQRRGPKR